LTVESDARWVANVSLVGFLSEAEVVTGVWNFQNNLTANGSDVCTPANGLCNNSGTGSFTQWLLASGDTAGSQAITNGTTMNVTGGTSITVTRSTADLTIDVDDDTIDGTELADSITLDEELAISGDNVSIDTSVLFVDTANDRVGVGVATPTKTLDVSDGSKAITFDPEPTTPVINTTSGNLTIDSAGGYVIINIG